MDPSTITTMSPLERRYFEDVSSQCSGDVHHYCDSGLPPSGFSLISFNPPPPMLMIHDFGSIVEDMMRSMVVDDSQFPEAEEPVPAVAPEHHDERSLDTTEESKDTANEEESLGGPIIIVSTSFSSPCEELFVRHMMSQFFPIVAPEETDNFAQKLVEHGNVMLERQPEEGSFEFRVARRLSEVTSEEVVQHRLDHFLPFSTERNDCLFEAYQQRHVSLPCGNALSSLEQVRSAQFEMRVEQRKQELDAYANLTAMYFLIFATAIVLFCRRKSMTSQANRDPMAVQRMRKTRLFTVIVFSGLSLLCLLGYLPTSVLLQACVWFSAYVFVRALFASASDNEVDACACCCCAATPQDAESGNLTEAQNCCSCCCGTGVCSDQCASCCGANCCDDGCCDGEDASNPEGYKLLSDDIVKCCECACCADGCCGGGCCSCCSGGDCSLGKKQIRNSRHEIYEGVPVQIV